MSPIALGVRLESQKANSTQLNRLYEDQHMSNTIKTTAIAIIVLVANSNLFAQKFDAKKLLQKGLKIQRQVDRFTPKPSREIRPNQVIRDRIVPDRRGPFETRQIDHGTPGNPVLAYFSKRLGCRFEIQWIRVGNFPAVRAARIVSKPAHGSPLNRLGLSVGDVITRLDGNPVTSTYELDRHVYDTNVRYVKAGHNHVHQGTIYIDAHRYFNEPYYPPTEPHCPNQHGGGLRP